MGWLHGEHFYQELEYIREILKECEDEKAKELLEKMQKGVTGLGIWIYHSPTGLYREDEYVILLEDEGYIVKIRRHKPTLNRTVSEIIKMSDEDFEIMNKKHIEDYREWLDSQYYEERERCYYDP